LKSNSAAGGKICVFDEFMFLLLYFLFFLAFSFRPFFLFA